MTRQQAINAFCKSCIYDPVSGDGTWRQQVAKCTAEACALFAYRPKPSGPRANPIDPEISARMARISAKRGKNKVTA